MDSESESPQALYVGTTPSGDQMLVTVWRDGTATIAFRPSRWDTWSPARSLRSMPVE